MIFLLYTIVNKNYIKIFVFIDKNRNTETLSLLMTPVSFID